MPSFFSAFSSASQAADAILNITISDAGQNVNTGKRDASFAYTWDGQRNNVSRPLRSVSAGLTYESLFKM